MPRIYLSPPDLAGTEMARLGDAVASNWIAPLGPDVDAFEAEVAAVVGMPHAVALSSGTAALHLALLALRIGTGDQVWTSTFTFAATANAIAYTGATPVFVDSDLQSWNMDPDLLAHHLERAAANNSLPRAVIAVDLYGQPAAYEFIAVACKRYDVWLIEDAAEALGATYRGRPAGSFGDLSILSFNGNKIITTSGGGMLLGARREWIERARYLATQARAPVAHYEHHEIGFNYRMSNLLAAFGRAQLSDLERRVDARRAIYARYRAALEGLPGWTFMPEAAGCRSTFWLTCVRTRSTDQRDAILAALSAADIEARPLWKPMHLQPTFAHHRVLQGNVSEGLFRTGLCLPSGSRLSSTEQDRVIEIVRTAART